MLSFRCGSFNEVVARRGPWRSQNKVPSKTLRMYRDYLPQSRAKSLEVWGIPLTFFRIVAQLNVICAIGAFFAAILDSLNPIAEPKVKECLSQFSGL